MTEQEKLEQAQAAWWIQWELETSNAKLQRAALLATLIGGILTIFVAFKALTK